MEKRFVDRFKALEALGKRSTTKEKQQRGRDFEILINDVFEDEKILLKRSYHTSDNSSEQIDGAIEVWQRVCLVEVKWVSAQLAASQVGAFQGKIISKFKGTLGVFISRNPLSDNFVSSLNRGHNQQILVIHGQDLDLLFHVEGPNFAEYISHCLKIVSYDNVPYFSVQDYVLHIEKEMVKINMAREKAIKDAVIRFSNEFLETKSKINYMEMHKIYALYKEDFRSSLMDYVAPNYKNAIKNYSNCEDDFSIQNYAYFILNVQPNQLIVKQVAEEYFNLIIVSDFRKYGRPDIFRLFKSHFYLLPVEVQNHFSLELYEAFSQHFGNFADENLFNQIYEGIWTHISKENNALFYSKYIEIFLSTRSDKYSQKSFANYLIKNEQIPKSHIENWIKEKLKHKKEKYKGKLDDETKFSMAIDFSELLNYTGIARENWKTYIIGLVDGIK